MSDPPGRFVVEVSLADTGQPLVSSDWHLWSPKRHEYFSEDVEQAYATREEAQAVTEALNAANPRPWVIYGVAEIIEVIPTGEGSAE